MCSSTPARRHDFIHSVPLVSKPCRETPSSQRCPFRTLYYSSHWEALPWVWCCVSTLRRAWIGLSWVDFRDSGVETETDFINIQEKLQSRWVWFFSSSFFFLIFLHSFKTWQSWGSTPDALGFSRVPCLPNWPVLSMTNYYLTPSPPSRSFICLLKWKGPGKLNCSSPSGPIQGDALLCFQLAVREQGGQVQGKRIPGSA